MRSFIRHPSDIPLVFSRTGQPDSPHREPLKDVGEGGLCFRSDEPVEPGTRVHIRIAVRQPPFEVDGVVAWCDPHQDSFDVGVQFDQAANHYSVRMVEQVCHIEQYRLDVARYEGRRLSGDQAAREWIARHAETFPAVH